MADPSFSATIALQARWANSRVATLIDPLTDPLPPDEVPRTLRQVVAFCHLFVVGGPHQPVISPDGTEERIRADGLAEETLKMARSMAQDARAVLGLNMGRRKVLYNHIMGAKHSGRPLVELLLMVESAIHRYVGNLNKRMVDAIKRPQALGAASELLFVGIRDWPHLTRWEKMNVTLEAQRYFHDMKGKALTRRTTGSSFGTPEPSSSVQASLSHQHFPSLTARQAQRSGVSQARLRARWA